MTFDNINSKGFKHHGAESIIDNWYPIAIPVDLESEITDFQKKEESKVDSLSLHSKADYVLSSLISQVAKQIIDREGLPHIAHLICGWGNSQSCGRNLLSYVADFVILREGKQLILQSDQCGDFHPWQTFAYCIMADKSLLKEHCGDKPLGEIIANSIDLNTSNETDLGHFLYTYAHLDQIHRPLKIKFDGKFLSILEIVDLAIEGHINGGFEVCRKFHLTEGLCAIAKHLDLPEVQQIAEKFLKGQLKCLDYLWAVVHIIKCNSNLSLIELPIHQGRLLLELRRRLVLGEAVENLYYYAGHLIELAAISIECGFKLAFEFSNTILCLIEDLDGLLLDIYSELTFSESFYAFAHYRRGTRMFLSITGRNSLLHTPEQLNFDEVFPTSPDNRRKQEACPRPFYFAPAKTKPRQYFADILKFYDDSCRIGFETRGEFPHFRKILLPSLPIGIHYEFLDCDHSVGIEIHCEREAHSDHVFFINLLDYLRKSRFESATFDPSWHNGCGRILVRYSESVSPQIIGTEMQLFIEESIQKLTDRYN